jgi:hypothetical protein
MNELATTNEPSVALMLQGALQAIQGGEITTMHVDVLGKMMDLYERQDKRQSEKDFAAALTALQGETIRVVAMKPVQNNDGTIRYWFAPYETIMKAVQPMLTRHGFSITFDTEIADTRLTSICTLTHSGGHFRQNRCSMKYSKPPGSSDAQGDMSTKSYAKRGALCDALNISIDHDDDARNEGSGETISAEEAKELQRRVKACGSDEIKFLAFAGANSFLDIPADKLPSLLDKLARKEREKAAKTETMADLRNKPDLF